MPARGLRESCSGVAVTNARGEPLQLRDNANQVRIQTFDRLRGTLLFVAVFEEAMVLALLVQAVDKSAFPDTMVAPQPPMAIGARVMPPVDCSIRKAKRPPEHSKLNKDYSISIRYKNRWVRFTCPDRASDEVYIGRDGSVLMNYTVMSSPMTSAWTTDNNHPQKKWLSKNAYDPYGWYQDAKNSFTWDAETNILGWATTPPILELKKDGKLQKLGWGYHIKCWWPTEVLAEVMIDDANKPTDFESSTGKFLRFYDHGVPSEIGEFNFLDAMPDHTLVLNENSVIYRWKYGKFLSAVKLPDKWEPVLMNRKGDLLVRHRCVGSTRDGRQSDEVTWEMGILRGADLYPMSYKRPKGSEGLLWRQWDHVDRFDGADGYFFCAFWGKDMRYYKITPKSPLP